MLIKFLLIQLDEVTVKQSIYRKAFIFYINLLLKKNLQQLELKNSHKYHAKKNKPWGHAIIDYLLYRYSP